MFPASNKGLGMNIGFPDPCLTPVGPTAVPVPYPNIAMNAQAAPFSTVVRTSMVPALNMGSIVPLTNGDQAGVAHPTIMGPGKWTMGNPKVFVEKLPGINLTCPSTGNGMNNGLGAAIVASLTRVFYTYSGAAPRPDHEAGEGGGGPVGLPSRELDREELEAMGAALSRGVAATELLDGGVVYARIGAFAPTLPSEMWSLLSGQGAAGVTGLVIDLSGCPGGDLMACLEAAGDFLPAGTHLATLVEADGDETPFFGRSSGPFSGPVAIVVDGATASAAEVFAGCLSAHGRAVLVGGRTYGKGSGQRVAAAGSGAVRSVSVGEVRLPGGRRIEGEGLSPDIEARSNEEARALAVGAVLGRCG
jgi:carboxyl-terminal processing protease